MGKVIISLFLAALFTAGCATVGREFDVAPVESIEIGETTREQIRAMFGEPWRTGIEDGKKTWTYGHYSYSLFGDSRTRDLLLRFDDEGKVSSYSFNSSYPEDSEN